MVEWNCGHHESEIDFGNGGRVGKKDWWTLRRVWAGHPCKRWQMTEGVKED